MNPVCTLQACTSDTPCLFGRCRRPWPWRRTPASVIEPVITAEDADHITGSLSLEQYITLHDACREAWYFGIHEYVELFHSASPSDTESCRRFIEQFPVILLQLRRRAAKPGTPLSDLKVKPKKRTAKPSKPPQLAITLS